MAWIVFDSETGAELRRTETTPELAEGEEAAIVSAAPGALWSADLRGWVDAPPPRRLTGLQILGLYTSAQHARARRMLVATFPAGHPQAGEFVDPDGMVQRLVDATLALRDPIAINDPFHVNGTMFLRSIGVIESDAEAARILAGIPPTSPI